MEEPTPEYQIADVAHRMTCKIEEFQNLIQKTLDHPEADKEVYEVLIKKCQVILNVVLRAYQASSEQTLQLLDTFQDAMRKMEELSEEDRT